MSQPPPDFDQLRFDVNRAFSPAAPVDEKALFTGRNKQIEALIDAICQRGQHAIIFGERGVGKTSLANVLSSYLQRPSVLHIRVNCDATDGYSSVWTKVFAQVQLTTQYPPAGFGQQAVTEIRAIAETLPPTATPELVRITTDMIGRQALFIVTVDEFDRLSDDGDRRLFADTVKVLSDFASPATLILVGVADSVEELISEHQSIDRALVQVCMPRMSREELQEIITRGLTRVGMAMEPDALAWIAELSQGLPHYTHLVGLEAARQAIYDGQLHVTSTHAGAAIQIAIDKAQQTIKTSYHRATMSPRKEHLYGEVLLACALTEGDEQGYFAAADVREPLKCVTGRNYEIPAFSRHLHELCETGSGKVLRKIGSKHAFRFRFNDPLLQPFVVMKGIADGRVKMTNR